MQRASEQLPAWWTKTWEQLTPEEKDEVREFLRTIKRNPTRPTAEDAVVVAARRRG